MFDRANHAQRRMVWALAGSALLHVCLLQAGEGSSTRRAAAAHGTALTATLQPLAQDFPESQAPSVAPASRVAPQAQPTRDTPAAVAAPRGVTIAATAPLAPRAPAISEGNTRAAVAGDPTYYPARSLDVYPRALTALYLGAQTATGSARATVLIDETGNVNDVRAIEADTVELQHAARALLLRTRFSPAAIDGRMVKAQLLISLDYGVPLSGQ
jgi:hypothetical protein